MMIALCNYLLKQKSNKLKKLSYLSSSFSTKTARHWVVKFCNKKSKYQMPVTLEKILGLLNFVKNEFYIINDEKYKSVTEEHLNPFRVVDVEKQCRSWYHL